MYVLSFSKDTLRDWCHIKGDLGNLKIFQDSEHSYNFLIKLLKKHMTEETLSNCDNPDDLIQVAEILLNAKKNDEKFMEYFVRVVNRMITLNPSDKSENFLKYIISESENIKLDFSFIEKIYCNQKKAFIEKPLADCFFTYCSDQSKLEELNKLDPLLEKITNSATLFQIVSMQMKEFFLSTEYSKVSVDFIQNILKKIQLNCDKKNKNIFSLYPSNLQHCVILLRINPSDHSEKSRNHTVNSLKDIFLKDWSGTLILISHFPDWLIYYLKFFEVLDEMSQKSVEIISIDDDDDADKCM